MKISLPRKINPGIIDIPSDKSISHRAVIFSALCKGKTYITNFLNCDDTITTINIFKRLGVCVEYNKRTKEVLVTGKGKYLEFDGTSLWTKESGTTMRLLVGLFATQKFQVVLKAAPSLHIRPMTRVIEPLRLMGADIEGRKLNGKEYPSLKVKPSKALTAITYDMPVPSAQVKSCLMFAGLYAKGETVITETYVARDHTERALKLFGANIVVKGKKITLKKSILKSPKEIFVPGDISSAAFFIALGLLLKNDEPLVLKQIGINQTRDGFLKVVKRMGAKIKLKNINKKYYEPYADIEIYPSELKGIEVDEKELPSMIDELPLVFMLATFAKGKTVIKGVKELRVKETDRIASMQDNLLRMGASFKVSTFKNKKGEEDFKVEIAGGKKLNAIKAKSYNDHRTAMAIIIAHMALKYDKISIDNVKCINKSFPEFLDIISKL